MSSPRIIECLTTDHAVLHALHRGVSKKGVVFRAVDRFSHHDLSQETQQLQSVNLMPVDQLIVVEPAKLGIGDVARILESAAASKVPACVYVVPNHAVETPQDQAQREIFEKVLENQGAKIFHSPAQYADYLDQHDVIVADIPDAGQVDEWKAPANY